MLISDEKCAFAYLWCFVLNKYATVDPLGSEFDDYIYSLWYTVRIA